MNIQHYIENVNRRFQTGISREHAYRGDLQMVLKILLTIYFEFRIQHCFISNKKSICIYGNELSLYESIFYQKNISSSRESMSIVSESTKLKLFI
jgi:hypothetical protein